MKHVPFFAQVNSHFERAAEFTEHPRGLLRQIKTCNQVFHTTFPLRRDDGTIESIHEGARPHDETVMSSRGRVAGVLDCYICLGFWLGTGLGALWWWWCEHPAYWLGGAMVAAVFWAVLEGASGAGDHATVEQAALERQESENE